MITQYFSKDPEVRAKFIFNLIAPAYRKVEEKLKANYIAAMDALAAHVPLRGKSVLDIGSGTGAWAVRFQDKEVAHIEAVDFSRKMLEVAAKQHPDIRFSYGDAENLKQFADKSFDIATASYVLHGVKAGRREKMLREMKRVAREYVIIHDFWGRTPLFVRFLEFMEKSDYKQFKKSFRQEMEATFREVKVFPVRAGAAVYVGYV